jgi:hypothetical protein
MLIDGKPATLTIESSPLADGMSKLVEEHGIAGILRAMMERSLMDSNLSNVRKARAGWKERCLALAHLGRRA